MKILIDAFGCDDQDSFIRGIADAINEIEGVNLAVSGSREYIEKVLSGVKFDRSRLEFIDAPDVITNDDEPVMSIRKKKQSSLVAGYEALRDRDDIPIMITAGNSGAVIAGAILILGREDRLDRPTLVTFFPNDKGGQTCLADCGANVDCRPEHLVKFAEYASDYMNRVHGIEKPRVALLSVGTEDKKGNTQTKEAFALLRESELNFVGNMEARTALSGDFDVIVADGFNGNILLKSIEGTFMSVTRRLVSCLMKNIPEGTDPSFIKKSVEELRHSLDFNTQGGAVLLGVKKPIVKAHGSAVAETVVNTVKQALKIVR